MNHQIIIGAKPEMTAGELLAVTGIYPQKAYYYRRMKGFPASTGGKYLTCEVVKWLRAAGYSVEIV